MRAEVSWHFAGENDHAYWGEIEIEPLPPGSPLVLGCKVRFRLHGKIKLGTVQSIVPAEGFTEQAIVVRLSKPAP
jgi:hypothetical protein